MQDTDSDQKRRLQNANRRRRYAQLPQEKKNQLLQKKRNRYAASKRPTLTDNQSTPSQQTRSDEISYISETDLMETCRPSDDLFNAKVADSDQKRTLKNANRRRRYAHLPQKKKIEILQKKRNRYAESKRPTLTDNQCTPSQQTRSDEISYISETDMMETCRPSGTQPESSCYASNKGKAKMSYYNLLDTGSQSLCVDEAHCSTEQPISFAPGKKIAVTYCDPTDDGCPDKTVEDVLKNIFDSPSNLPSAQPCKYCEAKRFYHESKGFCCSDGEVSLVSNTIPNDLYNLYTSQSKVSNEFRTYIRTYNNTFAFTSFGVKYDKELCKRNKGIYTFKIQGQVYHYINEICPSDNEPTYLQLYFYDTEHEITNRINQSNKLNATIVEQLIDILNVNPYATFFRSLTDIANLSEQKIIIKADAGLDQRVFNSPSSSQIAAIMLENTESTVRRRREIMVSNYSDYKHKVEYYYGCYDPLQYPLLFPYGETGWHQGIERANKDQGKLCEGQFLVAPRGVKSANELITKEAKVLSDAKKNPRRVSCREYYCWRLVSVNLVFVYPDYALICLRSDCSSGVLDQAFIEEVMDLVELITPIRKALVGLPGVNGLSTEHHKRLTIKRARNQRDQLTYLLSVLKFDGIPKIFSQELH